MPAPKPVDNPLPAPKPAPFDARTAKPEEVEARLKQLTVRDPKRRAAAARTAATMAELRAGVR